MADTDRAHSKRQRHVWRAMMKRCYDPRTPGYKNYGGRGIAVCARWREFKNFLADMGARPSSDHSIDRIDNDGPYSPENCRWATKREQGANIRKNVFVEFNGERLCVQEWSRRIGIGHNVLLERVRRGLSPAEILAPVHPARSRKRRAA